MVPVEGIIYQKMDRIGATLAVLVMSLAAASAARPATAAVVPVDLELVLAVDVSGSIDEDDARLQRDGYIAAIVDPRVVAAIRSGILGRIAVTYFEWSGVGRQRPVLGWSVIHDEASALRFADALARATIGSGRWTSISSALDYAAPLFAANGVEAERRVIDISGDGPNNWGDPVTGARDRAVASGVTVNGLPILDEGGGIYSALNIPDLDLYYRDCVIGGPGAFLVVAADFTDFGRAIRRKLILEIAGRRPRPAPGISQVAATRAVRASPPCDIGEQLMRELFEDF